MRLMNSGSMHELYIYIRILVFSKLSLFFYDKFKFLIIAEANQFQQKKFLMDKSYKFNKKDSEISTTTTKK